MKLHRFQARSSAEAVRLIQAELGPTAVVTQVNRIPVRGLASLWRQPELEVLAYAHEEESEPAPAIERTPTPDPAPLPGPDLNEPSSAFEGSPASQLLQRMGLLPVYADQVLDRARGQRSLPGHGVPTELVRAAIQALRSYWRPAPDPPGLDSISEVFVGPPGSGKTTVIGKWLTQAVLNHGRKASLWLLEGDHPTFAGRLGLHCEMLGVPVHPAWKTADRDRMPFSDQCFLDTPGVTPRDAALLRKIGLALEAVPNRRVHLVLNAAYSARALMDQIRLFSALPVDDLILTHLDEEKQLGKLWNVLVGTKYTIRSVASGQNFPGDLRNVTVDDLLGLPRRG
jgi:flagellar biosynthesis protein FlhF